MALFGYAAIFAWSAAALLVYAGTAVGIGGRVWVRANGRLQAAGMLLVVLLAQRATFPKPRRSRGHGAVGVEVSERNLVDEAYFWLLVIAVCVLGLVAIASVTAVRRRRRGQRQARMPLHVPARRYSERRRA